MVFMATINLLTQEDKTKFCLRADPFYEEASKVVYLAKQAFWMECSRSSAWQVARRRAMRRSCLVDNDDAIDET